MISRALVIAGVAVVKDEIAVSVLSERIGNRRQSDRQGHVYGLCETGAVVNIKLQRDDHSIDAGTAGFHGEGVAAVGDCGALRDVSVGTERIDDREKHIPGPENGVNAAQAEGSGVGQTYRHGKLVAGIDAVARGADESVGLHCQMAVADDDGDHDSPVSAGAFGCEIQDDPVLVRAVCGDLENHGIDVFAAAAGRDGVILDPVGGDQGHVGIGATDVAAGCEGAGGRVFQAGVKFDRLSAIGLAIVVAVGKVVGVVVDGGAVKDKSAAGVDADRLGLWFEIVFVNGQDHRAGKRRGKVQDRFSVSARGGE